HGPRLRELDTRHGGSLVDAQVAVALAGGGWPETLLADVASVTAADFVLRSTEVDVSLDLLVLATRP
ncbi:MAG: SAM-dependent methyltransferase, partial [Actinomycetes bacterium]